MVFESPFLPQMIHTHPGFRHCWSLGQKLLVNLSKSRETGPEDIMMFMASRLVICLLDICSSSVQKDSSLLLPCTQTPQEVALEIKFEAGKRDILHKNDLILREATLRSLTSSMLKTVKGLLSPKVLSSTLGCVAGTSGASFSV